MSDLVPWAAPLGLDTAYGLLDRSVASAKRQNPQLVVNAPGQSMLRTLRAELRRSSRFAFSVAFVSPRAIALLKQELVDFSGLGAIITSDYLGFNSPAAFAELLALRDLGIDVRIHQAKAFHPKGYIFGHEDSWTAVVGSSNLTEGALATNHEWNLRISAAAKSDLGQQLESLVASQVEESRELDAAWIADYAESYLPPMNPATARALASQKSNAATTWEPPERLIAPNAMQLEALLSLGAVRRSGKRRALVISATGTGKTLLSAMDVRAAEPARMLFLAHREQILDRSILAYKSVLGGHDSDYGKLSGTAKQQDRRYVFATVQTLSQPGQLAAIEPTDFDYIVVDEAHRAGAATHRRIIDHFDPAFLLGMTATPERTDGFNVFELFEYNVPYEIRLQSALEQDMLSPFHYYGVADFTLDSGETVTDETELRVLISSERVAHLVKAIETYGQAGVEPRGLIFCSRKDEARSLAEALNGQSLRGRKLRTIALTGDDSIPHRENAVERLENGDLDYILTVDVFNEGVDIPSVNQVIMLRQTQSAIVFVQQLGRGLRKSEGKEYVVVIDFIGNYANNYLIPTALFGNQSLNRESLRESLIAAEEVGVLPGLSSVRFDRIAQERVLKSLTDAKLDSFPRLKSAIETIQDRVGAVPALADFLRFESVDPVVLATRLQHYPALLARLFKLESNLTDKEDRFLHFLSHEVLPAKRQHEAVLLRELLDGRSMNAAEIGALFDSLMLPSTPIHVASVIRTLGLSFFTESERNRYKRAIVEMDVDGSIRLTPDFIRSYHQSQQFSAAVDDVLYVAREVASARYLQDEPFTPARNYSRKDAGRLLGWTSNQQGVIYGYKVDKATQTCPIFVTLHKSDEVAASTAYEDQLLDERTLLWYTRSNRTLASAEVASIVQNAVELHVFVKKDDAEGTDFYYLGRAKSSGAEQTEMSGGSGATLPVVRMLLRFEAPIEGALYDYLAPVITE